MTDEQHPVEQRQSPQRRPRRDHSTYEPAPRNFRPLWGLLLFLVGVVAVVAIAAAVVDTLVLN